MKRQLNLTLTVTFLASAFSLPVIAQASFSPLRHERAVMLNALPDTDRDRDGLVGPVRRVKTEMVKLSSKDGKVIEGQRVVLESVAYDIKGTKIENAYFPIPGAALTGKEVYKYDDKGNIIEMTLMDEKGTLLSKEVYAYEFDAFGNWTKMTTSVAVIEGGKITFEPTEVTYRSISYYLDEATLAKMSQAATAPVATAAAKTPAPGSTGAANGATSKPAAPLPTGGSLVKTNVAASNAALNMSGNVANDKAAVKLNEEAPPPPVARAPKPLLKPVSGGVLNGKAIVLPKPTYSAVAKSARASGLVVVEVVIDESGKVVAAKAVSGPDLLRQSAVQAAQGARFSPTMLSGQPVKVTGLINYNFAFQQ